VAESSRRKGVRATAICGRNPPGCAQLAKRGFPLRPARSLWQQLLRWPFCSLALLVTTPGGIQGPESSWWKLLL